jgi:hypothetical protein
VVRRPLIGLLYQPRMIDDDDCGAVGGMIIGRGNRITRRKSVPAPVCPPQIPHDLKWAGTRAAGVGSRKLTACVFNLQTKNSTVGAAGRLMEGAHIIDHHWSR